MGDAIRVEALTKVYPGGVEALRDVSFAVGDGEIFGYLGRNGAGKTTTVRILTTLARKTSGSVMVCSHDVDSAPDAVRSCIGVALQEFGLDEFMTATEHVELLTRLHGAAAEPRGLLERFGLAQAADRRVGTFSWGMRRRLDLALALVRRPAVLFCDEPTTGLDPQGRRTIWSAVRELRDGGATVFLTTQYIDEADHLADRIAILEEGRIVADGAPQHLKAELGRTRVRLRLRDPSQRDRVSEALAGVRYEVDGADGLCFELSRQDPSLDDVFGGLRRHDIDAVPLEVSPPSLEELFVELTGQSPINTDPDPVPSDR